VYFPFQTHHISARTARTADTDQQKRRSGTPSIASARPASAFTVKINLTGDGETPHPVTTLIHVLESLQQAVISSASQRELDMLHDGYPHSRENSVTSQGVADPSPAQREADLEALMAECRKVFDGVCRVMKGPPCHFVLKEGAIPEKFRGSRHVSEPLKEPFKEEFAAQVK
jgi:hypothetical protein